MGSRQKNVTQSTAPWAPAQPYILDYLGQSQDLVGQPTNPYTVSSQNQLAGLAGSTGLQNQISGIGSTLGLLTDPSLLSPDTNPYLAQTAQAAARPVTQALTEQVLPNIRGGAIGAGQYGGTRQGIAEGIASRGALQTIADQSAGIYSNAYQGGLDTLLQGLALSPMALQAQAYPAGLLGQIGAQQEALPWQRLQSAAGIAGPALGAGGTQTQPYFSNPAADYAGIGTGLLSLYALGAFSSKKLKENFSEVDESQVLELVRDVPVEGWQYVGQPDKHIGPYAEDFKEILGIGDGNTIPIVDYLGVLFASVKELTKQVEALKEVVEHGTNH